MEHAIKELMVFSVMAGMGAATGILRGFLWALLGFNGGRRRLTTGQAVGDVAFSVAAAAAVVTSLFRLNSATVRFYALGGFGVGLMGYELLLSRMVVRGAHGLRSLPGNLISFIRRT